MFIGHYAPALALKPVARGVPLWALFVAVQLLDFGWDLFVLIGIEHVRLVPHFTASNDLDLYDMPWTHSLAAALVWSAAAAAIAYRLAEPEKRVTALAIGAAVFSHWALDLLVHAGDLTVAGPSTPHLGFALWNHPTIELALEIVPVVLAGAFAASRAPKPRPVLALTLLLAVVAVIERLVPAPASVSQLVVSAFAAYVAFALAARRVDRMEASG